MCVSIRRKLFTKRRLAANTVIQRLAALRFFFIKTLRKPWSVAETPYPKKTVRLPMILSQEEVAQLVVIDRFTAAAALARSPPP